MINSDVFRFIVLGVSFTFLLTLIIIPQKNDKTNWSFFFHFIWMLITLPAINYLCVEYQLWEFCDETESLINIPYDILFCWLVLGLVPLYIFKGKHPIILVLSLLWIDFMTMPLLEEIGILRLNDNWLIGEIIVLVFVFLPGYLWSRFYLENKYLKVRALFQVITMGVFLTIIVPFLVKRIEGEIIDFKKFSSLLFQISLIIVFPSLIAVIDLISKGNGTPFPFDKTKNLVTSGAYAYIKNPIQWSFSLIFIPLSIYHESWLLLGGTLISVFYALSISNPQEYEDMKLRFGTTWEKYKNDTPSWFFQWQPKHISKGTIYFKKDCQQCEGVKSWFESKHPINLDIKYAREYKNETLLQATYTHHLSNLEYKSVKAIAHGLEHINLAYATLGWFMRFPIICFILQSIVDALGFSESEETCKIDS